MANVLIRLKTGCSISTATGETVRYDTRVVRRITERQVLGSDTHLKSLISSLIVDSSALFSSGTP